MKLMPIIYPGTHKFRDEVNRLRGAGLLAFMIAVPYDMLDEKASVKFTGETLSTHLGHGGMSAKQAVAILRGINQSVMIQSPEVYHKQLLALSFNWALEHDQAAGIIPK